jgi:hypothetical protein
MDVKAFAFVRILLLKSSCGIEIVPMISGILH